MERIEHIKNKIKSLSLTPGVYLFKDKTEKVIYVGKAVKLKNRVSSYFRENQTGKTKLLVSKIIDFETIKVDTEEDALLLENSLIKKYQPKYNILLKDDKSYPWICIKKESFPRIFSTRRVIKDGSEYFGPYTSVRFVRTLLDMIRNLYPIRSCKFNLSEENIAKGKYKVCLDYHIKKCLGGCEGLQEEKDYLEDINEIREILKGNTRAILKTIENKMKLAAADLDFENAQAWKEKWTNLKNYSSKSTVVSSTIHNVDVFSILTEDNISFVNYFKVMNGSIIQSYTTEYKKIIEIDDSELLQKIIIEIRERFSSSSTLVITNIPCSIEGSNFVIHTPQRGEKKELIHLSEKNAKYYKMEKWKQIQQTDPERHTNRMLEQLKKDLRLKELPKHMECFDNSNFQGAEPVAACVVFRNAKPFKKDYRHFLIKTVIGPDDFASMTEVLKRRYKRMLAENESLPQLIIVDGGKGQLSAGVKALKELDLYGKIAIIGIAKRLEEIYFPNDPYPLYLDKRSESLKVIQKMRDEAHRFGITHHRGRRIKNSLKTELNDIKGLGPKTTDLLLKKFKSVQGVKKASEKDLTELIGKHKANIVIAWKNKKQD